MNNSRLGHKAFRVDSADSIHSEKLSGAILVDQRGRQVNKVVETNNNNRQAMKTFSKNSSLFSQWGTRDSRGEPEVPNKLRRLGGRKGRTSL